MSATYNEPELLESIGFAASKLGIEKVRETQQSALLQYLRKHDVFVSLETGGGKSFIFQAAPLCHDFLRSKHEQHQNIERAFAIIVSPITALIEDQISSLTSKNINAVHLPRPNEGNLTEWESVAKKVVNGEISLLYTSPETLSTKLCRDLLTKRNVRENVCGIFVDESHCIYKWGHSSDEAKSFRADYGRLAELRAFLPSNIPVVALTATATTEVRQAIISSLQLSNVHLIEGSPNRVNIKYIVIDSYARKLDQEISSWLWLTSRLNTLQSTTPRIIVYCRSRAQCTNLYGIFKSEVTDEKHVAMYHATTNKKVQVEIVKDFEQENGQIRVLFATIAFGMGVNVKGVHTILHLGVPNDIDDYIQESGRAGRDGKQSVSIMIKYHLMYTDGRVKPRMKDFAKNSETCRRKLLLQHFNITDHEHEQPPHTCCDVCAASCKCDGEQCIGMQACQEEIDTVRHFGFPHQSKGDISSLNSKRQVPMSVRESLKQNLLDYRNTLLDDSTAYLAGGDITCGLPLTTINKIVMESSVVIPLEIFRHRYAIYRDELIGDLWKIVQDTLGECIIQVDSEDTAHDANITDNGSDDDDEENSDNEYDDDHDNDEHSYGDVGFFF